MLKLPQVFAESDEVAGFEFEIEFAEQTAAQPVQHVLKIVALAEFGMSIKKLGDLTQRFEILDDLFANVRPLNFNHNLPTVAHTCPVHLGQRGGSERLRIEIRERFRDTHADFARDDAIHFLIREWFDSVLQTRQRFEVRTR